MKAMSAAQTHIYLLRLQFLGFRYHGWQHQPGWQTVEGMLRKTFRFILPDRGVKFLGAGRTDARVSAVDFAVQVILKGEPLEDLPKVKEALSDNLPPDIRLLEWTPAHPGFNAIRDATQKTYRYLFATGTKPHPYSASFLGYFPGQLDVPAMQAAARMFEGTHNFTAFISGGSPRSRTHRTITSCQIVPNTYLTASFIPEVSYMLEVISGGFGRNQVRLMMAALVEVGQGQLELPELDQILAGQSSWQSKHIAPASGLHLYKTEFDIGGKSSTL